MKHVVYSIIADRLRVKTIINLLEEKKSQSLIFIKKVLLKDTKKLIFDFIEIEVKKFQ